MNKIKIKVGLNRNQVNDRYIKVSDGKNIGYLLVEWIVDYNPCRLKVSNDFYYKKWCDENTYRCECDKNPQTCIRIGMTSNEVSLSIGSPKSKNKTITNGVISEQWVYDKKFYQYIYIENGLVTSISTKE